MFGDFAEIGQTVEVMLNKFVETAEGSKTMMMGDLFPNETPIEMMLGERMEGELLTQLTQNVRQVGRVLLV